MGHMETSKAITVQGKVCRSHPAGRGQGMLKNLSKEKARDVSSRYPDAEAVQPQIYYGGLV